jgi:hypothetical protein
VGSMLPSGLEDPGFRRLIAFTFAQRVCTLATIWLRFVAFDACCSSIGERGVRQRLTPSFAGYAPGTGLLMWSLCASCHPRVFLWLGVCCQGMLTAQADQDSSTANGDKYQ